MATIIVDGVRLADASQAPFERTVTAATTGTVAVTAGSPTFPHGWRDVRCEGIFVGRLRMLSSGAFQVQHRNGETETMGYGHEDGAVRAMRRLLLAGPLALFQAIQRKRDAAVGRVTLDSPRAQADAESAALRQEAQEPDLDEARCRCRTYATPSGGGDGYGGSATDTTNCPIHDIDLAIARAERYGEPIPGAGTPEPDLAPLERPWFACEYKRGEGPGEARFYGGQYGIHEAIRCRTLAVRWARHDLAAVLNQIIVTLHGLGDYERFSYVGPEWANLRVLLDTVGSIGAGTLEDPDNVRCLPNRNRIGRPGHCKFCGTPGGSGACCD